MSCVPFGKGLYGCGPVGGPNPRLFAWEGLRESVEGAVSPTSGTTLPGRVTALGVRRQEWRRGTQECARYGEQAACRAVRGQPLAHARGALDRSVEAAG
jgi:hypothetical protein